MKEDKPEKGIRFKLILLITIAVIFVNVMFISVNGTTTQNPTSSVKTTANAAKEQIFYWIDTGEVYHSTPNCSALERTTHTIRSGILSQVPAGRRPCKVCIGDGVKPATTTAPKVTTTTQKPVNTTVPKVNTTIANYKIGNEINQNNALIKVNSVRTAANNGKVIAEKGFKFAYINITVTNNRSKAFVMSSTFGFTMKTPDGKKCDQISITSGALSGTIATKGKLVGEIGFKVPTTATKVTLEITDLASKKISIFDLQFK